jgi:hypothetical protein
MKQITLGLLLLALAGCGGDQSTPIPSPQTPPPAAIRPSATPPPATAAPRVTPTSGSPSTVPAATPVPPRLLADRAESQPRDGFGPVSPGPRWLVTRGGEGFALLALNGRPELALTAAISGTAGTPLDWSADGALLLFTTPATPTVLWALEPTTGVTLTLLNAAPATIREAAWLTTVIIYATDGGAGSELTINAYRGSGDSTVLARLPEHRLLDSGMITNPNRREVALLVSSTISPTAELYRLDEGGNLSRIDSYAGVQAGARAAWSQRGQLAYNLGAGLHIYNPETNALQDTGLDADPLAWQGDAILARQREDGALLRWSLGGIQPFDTGSGPLVIDDAQTLGAREVALLIGGQIWQVTLP